MGGGVGVGQLVGSLTPSQATGEADSRDPAKV